MFSNRLYQEIKVPQYSKGLIFCRDKKTCTGIAKTLNTSHDVIYDDLNKLSQSLDAGRNDLLELAKTTFKNNRIYLILDDTTICKPYSHEIEAVEQVFDGSSKQITHGFKITNVLLTDTAHKIPVDASPYVSKALAQGSYKSKSELASEFLFNLKDYFNVERVLADAHFATKLFINSLDKHGVNYLMKIPRNRTVTIDGKTGQLKEIFKLKKNSNSRVVKANFDGTDHYFYAVKLSNKKVVYFISNDLIDRSKIESLYKIRWNIETFYQVAKQHLGLKDCQARSIEKQLQHVIFVMHAYAYADLTRVKMKFHCIQDAIRWLRVVKST